MSVKTLLKTLGMAIALLLLITPLPTLAAGNQSNQDLHQPAMLIAPDRDFQISVYAKPEPHQQRIGYGMGGDRVTVLEQVGSNEGYAWNFVQFDRDANLAGWIQDNYVSLAPNETPQPQSQSSSSRRSWQSNQKSRNAQSAQWQGGNQQR